MSGEIALAITGFAGKGKQPGPVHFACARKDGDIVHREAHFGDIGRGPVRIAALRVALAVTGGAIG